MNKFNFSVLCLVMSLLLGCHRSTLISPCPVYGAYCLQHPVIQHDPLIPERV